MKTWMALLLALVGVGCLVAGAAWVYPPAGMLLFGALCVAVALVVEVRDT